MFFYKEKVCNEDQVGRNQKSVCTKKSKGRHDLSIQFTYEGLDSLKHGEIKSHPIQFENPINQEQKSEQCNYKQNQDNQQLRG